MSHIAVVRNSKLFMLPAALKTLSLAANDAVKERIPRASQNIVTGEVTFQQ